MRGVEDKVEKMVEIVDSMSFVCLKNEKISLACQCLAIGSIELVCLNLCNSMSSLVSSGIFPRGWGR